MTPEQFWEARPVFAHIKKYAQARRVSPWAMFGGVLARVVASTEPHIQTPPIVGGPGSLNLFVAIVGKSGQGKGASQAAAGSFLDIRNGAAFETITVGSGEGLAAAYVGRTKNEDGRLAVQQHSESAMFDIAEVDTLTALAGRQGSTLLSELRKVWSGERLGFQNRDQTRTLPVDAHSYRASLIVGVQPARAGAMLDDADGGTPQRFIWLPATDEHAPKRAPGSPGPMTWTAPTNITIPQTGENGQRLIDVCDEAWTIIDEAQVARLRGDGHALDGHALFSRLKVAAALALLDQRGGVSLEDWELAGVVMAVSDATRKHCRDTIRQLSIDANQARAEARAEANVVVADHTEIVTMETAKARILDKLTSDWQSAATIRRSLSTKLREVFEDALDEMHATSIVDVVRDEYQGQARARIRLASAVTHTTRGGESITPVITPEKPRKHAAVRGDYTGVTKLPPLAAETVGVTR